jgi:hypothetical protein
MSEYVEALTKNIDVLQRLTRYFPTGSTSSKCESL